MRTRLAGYAIAGVVLIAVSVTSAYITRSHANRPANLEFTLKDMDGGDVRLAQFKGQALIINFWATWCGPCLLETPELVELAEEYRGRGLRVIGISFNDTPDDVKRFAAEFKVSYPLLVGRDREDVFNAFGLKDGLPMSVFIRPDGTIAGEVTGIHTKTWFQEQIEALLAG